MPAGTAIVDSAGPSKVYQIPVTIEAGEVNNDIDVHIPVVGNKVYIVGLSYTVDIDHVLTFKSVGTTSTEIFKTAVGVRGYDAELGAGIIRYTEDGEKLVVNSSVPITNMWIHVTDGSFAYRSF